jgi:hypothetical protein
VWERLLESVQKHSGPTLAAPAPLG